MSPGSIKVMADYQCWPLWHHQSSSIGNIDPRSLPISSALVEALNTWSSMYDERLDLSDPAATVWSDAELRAFDFRGYELAELLQHEVGVELSVFYFSERTRQLMPVRG